MLPCFNDILDRIPETPKWWDSHGVPRYENFHPKFISNIYADEVVLLRIACQSCAREFDVEVMWDKFSHNWSGLPKTPFSQNISFIHYGDPPNVGCCPAGPTMNCIDLRVLQFWARENFKWVRKPELEIELERIEEYFGDENDRL